ncbi:MAG: photosystem II reaction center protein M [Symploca sp. SIO1A3]|nr:photosystem II reaction center protein M [Symploca sp. SIO2C1]NER52991.1 photosystem II reaction center protein M [Symploca sp. SIO1A3]
MQVNDLGFIATILFVLVPAVFLLILYIQTASSQGNQDS